MAKQWTDTEGIEFFGRHLVALFVTFQYEGEDKQRFSAFSGTLIQIQNTVFLLTAGHVLRNLEAARANAKVEITSAALADIFGMQRVSDIPIPFDFKNADLLYVDIEEEGLDFGVIPLREYYVGLLAKNGVIALAEQNWIHQSNVNFDAYVMLGLPEEFSSDEIDESGNCMVSPTMFRVHRLDPPPPGTQLTTHPRFVAKLDDENPIKSVVGMSGGPIFGFSLVEPVRYWVVALQSSWNPKTRIVYGCQLPIFASILTKLLKGEAAES